MEEELKENESKKRMKKNEDIWQRKTHFVKEAKNAGGEERKVNFLW